MGSLDYVEPERFAAQRIVLYTAEQRVNFAVGRMHCQGKEEVTG
jgi:hypothetical protein